MSEELRKGEFSESERRENFLEVKERVIPPPGSVAGGCKEGGSVHTKCSETHKERLL